MNLLQQCRSHLTRSRQKFLRECRHSALKLRSFRFMSEALPCSSTSNKPVEQRRKRGQGAEAMRVQRHLTNWSLEDSLAFKEIQKQFTSQVRHAELKSIAQVLCDVCPRLRLHRDAARDNRVLIKWFDDNWSQIQPIMPKIHLRDENEEIISETPGFGYRLPPFHY